MVAAITATDLDPVCIVTTRDDPSSLSNQARAEQAHAEQQPVVGDVRAGGHPDVLRQDPGQGQHHARRADDDDALDQVPVIGRKVDEPEEQR